MKKYLFFVCIILSNSLCFAQEYTTMWPYIFEDFTQAKIISNGGKEYNYKANIHIQESMLHYIEGDAIKEALISDINFVEISGYKYINLNNQIMRVEQESNNGYVAMLLLGDFDKLFESGGAYGSSSNVSAATKLSSLEVGGKSNLNYLKVLDGKSEGLPLDTITKYFLFKDGITYSASKSGILSSLSKDRQDEFKKFLKVNKIKWKEAESLLLVLNFL